MKKQIKYLVVALIASLLFGSLDAFAATTPTQSKTTDTSSKLYYNNNAATNPLLNDAGKAAAAKYPGGSDALKELQKANGLSPDGLIGNDTANLLNKQNSTNSTDPKVQANTTTPAQANKLVDNNSTDTNNLLGIETGKLRRGDVNMHDIAKVILSVIRFLLAIAGTVAVFSLIYHAVKMQLNSGITGDSSGVESAKKGMTSAIIGFVIAISAWFLVTRVVQILIEVS